MKKINEILREIVGKCDRLNEQVDEKKQTNIFKLTPFKPKVKRVKIGVLTGESATN